MSNIILILFVLIQIIPNHLQTGSIVSPESSVMKPKYSALFTSVNLLLGVGPLILPMPFFNAGIILSTLWLIIISLLSYNSALFVAQSMSKLHQIQYNSNDDSVRDTIISTLSQQQQNTNTNINSDKQIAQASSQQSIQQPLSSALQSSATQQSSAIKQYDHSTQFSLLFPDYQHSKLFPSIAIAVYLTGVSISKCIMTGDTLSKVFTDISAPQIFDNFQFWLFIFFVAGAVFSFKSIQKTKVLQTIIIAVRLISVLMFIGGALSIIISQGIKDLTPPDAGYFNFSGFVEIFSNSIFALLFHHSLPSIVSNLKTTEDVSFVCRTAFLISGSILLIIPLTASMAFGKDLGTGDKLIYYNFDFENKISTVYWVTSFYVFLNIAAFSVYIIVIRSYILNIIYPKINPRIFSKHTLISSILILTFVLLASWLLKNQVQIVLDFTGGIFGTVILFIIPSLEVWKARKIMHKSGAAKNYIVWLPHVILVIGFMFMGFNLFNIIKKLA